MRLIDADYLDELITQLNQEGRNITRNEYNMIDSILFEFPTANVVKRKDIEAECELAYKHGWSDCFAEHRWIPVTERLPKPNEKDENEVLKYYLIQDEFGDMMVAAYCENNFGYTWWEQMYAYKPIEDKVVAWMPLPEPYRPEGGEADV